ncbi:MAG TPA: DUF1217 domain-containing protein [Hyphomicrobium sp.]
MISTYLLYNTYASNLPKTLARVGAEPDVSKAAQYYQANIGKVTSVDDFLNNTRLFSYAMNPYGIATTVYQYYNYNATGTSATPAAAAYKTQYYKATISGVTSVDDLLANNSLLDVAVTAFGLDPNLQSKTLLRQILTSDLSDPNSVANQQSNTAYQKLAVAFNFNADGSVNGSVQTTDQLNNVTSLYSSDYGDTQQTANDARRAPIRTRLPASRPSTTCCTAPPTITS